MADRSTIISGEHDTFGTLFAAVDPTARYIQPKVSELRFAALLTPFKSVADAEAALAEAVASLSGGAK